MARIYKGKPAEVSYKGSAASIKFNPQQAANDERRIKQYKNAILQDGKAMAADLQRERAMENIELKLSSNLIVVSCSSNKELNRMP